MCQFKLVLAIVIACSFSVGDSTLVIPTTTEGPPPSDVCKICKTMVEQARDTLANNETMEEMKQVYEGTCKILIPLQSLKKLCIKYVDEIVPKLIEILYEEMDPNKVCISSGLCRASDLSAIFTSLETIQQNLAVKFQNVVMTHEPETLVKLVQSISISDEKIQNLLKGFCNIIPEKQNTAQCTDAISLYYPIVKSFLATNIKTGSECSLCELAVTYITTEVSQPSVENEIQSEFLKICPSTGSYEGECKAFINQYFPKVWSILVAEVKSGNVCKDVGLCSAKKTDTNLTPKDRMDVCTICKDLVAETRSVLLLNTAIASAKQSALVMCYACPVRDECKKYIEANFDKFYTGVIGKVLNGPIICKSLGVCSSYHPFSSYNDPRVVTVSGIQEVVNDLPRVELKNELIGGMEDISSNLPADEVECTVCKYIAHFLQEELNKKETVQLVENGLKIVCNRLPVASACVEFVDSYLPLIMQLLSKEIDPSKVCYKITNSCRSQTNLVLSIKPLEMNMCLACTLTVDYMDKLIDDNIVGADLSDIVDKVCSAMPQSAKKNCMEIVSLHGPFILQLIGEASNSKAVCQHINYCPKPHLLGEKKCNYGPSYWCEDMEKAKECHAVKHCQTRVWKQSNIVV